MTLEIVIAVLAAVILAVTYWMFWAGLAGSARQLSLKRCRNCGHLRVATSLHRYNASECMYCRHPWVAAHLLHNRLRHNFPREW